MKKKFNKILSVFLAMLIVIGILPLSTMAKSYTDYINEQLALEELLNHPVENTEDSTATIIGEVEEKRDEYTKVYKKDDGSYTAVMSVEPLHYLNDEGLWEEINNSMVLQNGLYTNTDNDFNVELPKDIDSNENLTVEKDGHSLSFSIDNIEESSAIVENNIVASDTNIPDADTAIAQTQSAVTYSEVAENTDLQYIVTPNSIKENIIVANKESVQSTYSFTFETNGLDAVKQDDGSVLFKDNANDVKFRIPRPVMTDSSLAFSYDIAVSLTENADDTVTLTYSPSTEWVNDTNRSYPITIDPAIVLEDNDENWVEDTVVGYDSAREETQTSNGYNDFIGVVANQTITNNSEEGTYIGEIYTKINTNFLKQLGDNIIVIEAQYLLSSATTNGKAYAKEIADEVNLETVTYDTKPSLSNEIIDYYTSPNEDEAEEIALAHFNITKPLNEWLNGEQNNGFAIVAGDSNFAGIFVLNGVLSYNNPSTNSTTTQTYSLNGYEITNTWKNEKLNKQEYKNDTTGQTIYTIEYIYDSFNTPQGFIINNSEAYLYLKNLYGDIIGIIDKSGNLVLSYEYDVWGLPTPSPNSNLSSTEPFFDVIQNNPIMYRGYYYDHIARLYYVVDKYYNPEIGMYINSDGFAPYWDNNPIAYSNYGEDELYRANTYANYLYNKNYSNIVSQDAIKNSKGFIYNQKSAEMRKYRYGFGNVGPVGCGVVATYNAAKMLGLEIEFHDILREYETNGVMMYGLSGAFPIPLARFFIQRGYDVTTTFGKEDSEFFNTKAMENTTNIMLYQHDNYYHYVAMNYVGSNDNDTNTNDNGHIYAYNTYCDGSLLDNLGMSIGMLTNGTNEYKARILFSISTNVS